MQVFKIKILISGLENLFKAFFIDLIGVKKRVWSLIFYIQICINCLYNLFVKSKTRFKAKIGLKKIRKFDF